MNKGRAKPLRLQQLDRHRGAVLTESRPRLHGATMSVCDRTLDALLDHIREQDLPTILARLADRSEPYIVSV